MNAAYRERRMWAKVRSSEWWERIVLQSWDDDDFKENFRVSSIADSTTNFDFSWRTFQHICDRLKPQIKKHFIRKNIFVERRVAVTLVKLGSSGELRTVANLFVIARCTACIIVREVCTALCTTFKITFPTQSDSDARATEFFDRSALPGCCGALDGCHIPIKTPSLNTKDYLCRKQFHRLILQAVVDGKFSFHEYQCGMARIYSAYPLLPWVMKPYGGRLTREMENFNKKLSCGRVSVEHAFGQLKANDSEVNNIKTQVLA
ncbi:putative nuclease HARBI1 [Trichonephila inaurata madagascariensis]|uniref:Putative nuclease HARBI1 n=1 Tax=Trichonephila inaurata madagascariensis TaxID=2747483 RepID=A0A8X6I7K9_9ARAC|nr:putative nuclease HARBI1 [Trichonephila inaurata madagascariensis]